MTSPKDVLTDRLYEDLIGPTDPLSEEVLTSTPTDVYLTGILFPVGAEISADEDEKLETEGTVETDSSGTTEDQTALSSAKRPSSMGLSFAIASESVEPTISIHVELGVYRMEIQGCEPSQPIEGSGAISESEVASNQPDTKVWRRRPVFCDQEIQLSNAAHQPHVSLDSNVGAGLYIKTRPWGSSWLVTVALMNENSLPSDYEIQEREEKSLFQTSFSVVCGEGTRFIPRPRRAMTQDEDTRMSMLLYRDAEEFAAGHTCSATWRASPDGHVLKATWMPKHDLKTISASGAEQFKSLSKRKKVFDTKWLSENSGSILIEELRTLPSAYEEWLASQIDRVEALGTSDLRDQARANIKSAQLVNKRISEAIVLLENDIEVQKAFRLANLAIAIQSAWKGGVGETTASSKALNWRPFQLAFILLSLASVSDDTHPDRETVDLLWFPTGGGKTEAYFGLIAFLIFLRRLRHGKNGAGVCSLMRYTLRLLTTQQFQRASALICACEAIRLREVTLADLNVDMPGPQISIGLWVGSDATPNSSKAAAAVLMKRDSNPSNSPAQLEFCPRHRNSRLNWKATENGQIRAYCSDSECSWSEALEPLPVLTVDEDIYQVKPSLVIGTVDKFAQIVRNVETRNLFGIGTEYKSPALIIQDELHLISGPLGTMVGLYEVAIDRLCSDSGTRPKVIASTATIRKASDQIRNLFNRATCMFPPPIIDANNSGFAVEDPELPGRRYVGVTTAGRSAKFTLQAASASLLQAAGCSLIEKKEKDRFWTLVNYFNSLRELGGALVLMQDDVPKSITAIAERRLETMRSIREPVELTSRVTQDEIRGILHTLSLSVGNPSACDAVLASNMISVGVDVPRLGVMVVNGQPKGVSEYIQATSRVGRDLEGPGGLVVTLYNNAKPRDRSFFESFLSNHKSLYREVEATSVTPFADRARERALHAVFAALVRHSIENLSQIPNEINTYTKEAERLLDFVEGWVESVDQSEAASTMDELREFFDGWKQDSDYLKRYWAEDFRTTEDALLISAERVAEIRARFGLYDGWAKSTPNSMRNVEPSTGFSLISDRAKSRGHGGRFGGRGKQ